MHHEGSSQALPGPGRSLHGAYCIRYFILHSVFHGIYHFTEASSPLERRLHGVPLGCSVLYNMHHEGSSPGPGRAWGGAFMAFKLVNSHSTQPGTYKLYCSRPLPAIAGRGLMRTLCCAACAMKGSGLGRCSMQLARGCLIHKLYPLTFSVATRPLSAFAGRGPRGKTMCYSVFFNNSVH